MPYSADENRDWVLAQVPEYSRVLDVGAGAGVYADLLRDRVEYIDAVEIYEPYIERFGLKSKYREVFLGDFQNLPFQKNSYDVLIMGDVLEHFTPEDAIDVWSRAQEIVGTSGLILMSTPIIDWPQGEVDGNIHEAHLSSFTIEDLKQLPGVLAVKEGEQIGSVVANGYHFEYADLTLVITTIPSRADRLQRALMSVQKQSVRPGRVIVQMDTEGVGAAVNRDAGLARVMTPLVAFLDDDDYLYPQHIEALYKAQRDTDADLVYSWFDVEGGTDPFPMNFGKEWDPESPVQTTVTTLGKTASYVEVGGYSSTDEFTQEELNQQAQGNTAGEDFRLVVKMNKLGKCIVHHPERTWAYVHWGGNTSGRSEFWS